MPGGRRRRHHTDLISEELSTIHRHSTRRSLPHHTGAGFAFCPRNRRFFPLHSTRSRVHSVPPELACSRLHSTRSRVSSLPPELACQRVTVCFMIPPELARPPHSMRHTRGLTIQACPHPMFSAPTARPGEVPQVCAQQKVARICLFAVAGQGVSLIIAKGVRFSFSPRKISSWDFQHFYFF